MTGRRPGRDHVARTVWSHGRGLLRRGLRALLPQNDWTAEFLRELDRDVAQRADANAGVGLTLWYVRQLVSPQTIGFVRAARARRRGASGRRRLGSAVAGLGGDLRQAWRAIARDRWVATLVVLTLAMGIGSVAAMYGLAQRLFLAGPPHVRAPGQLERIVLAFDDDGGRRTSMWIPYNTGAAIRDGVDAFDGASLYRHFEELVDLAGTVRPVVAVAADEHYFGLLGPRPVAGRFLQPGDVDAAVLTAPVAVEGFGSPLTAIGQRIRIGQRAATIVGVAPTGFAGPDLDRVDVWIPMDPDAAGSRNWWTIARVADRSRRDAAAAEAQAIHEAVDPGRFFQWALEGRVEMVDTHSDPSGERATETSIAALLLAVVALVLLIAWANVLNLLLARVTRRRGEVLVRLALGIGHWRLARLLLAESLVLSLLGGLASLPVAWVEGAVVRDVLLPRVAWQSSVVDMELLGVTFAAALVSALLLGLLPAGRANRTDLAVDLAHARTATSGGSTRTQTLLATAQVTLSAALLLCAALFAKSFWTMRVTDLGVDASEVRVVSLRSLDFRLGGGAEAEELAYRNALDAFRQRSDGARAALSIGLPFFSNFGMSIEVDGRASIPELPGGGPFVSAVSDGYFDTIGTDIIEGFPISRDDVATGALVMVIGEATARALWPRGDAIGRCVRLGTAENPCYRVVGVAEDVHREGYREGASLQIYVPIGATRSFRGPTLLVRPERLGGISESGLAGEIGRFVPGIDYVEVRRLETFLEPEIRPWKLGAVMLSMVAALAIVMSLAGVFGVLTYVVARRRREIGVRMALGASRASIRALVLRLGLTSGLAGVASGFLAVLASSEWLGPLLFETSVADPLVMAAVGSGLVAAALLACLLPASQAARVDPATSLRAET